MALILNIDTSTSNASICLAENGKCLFQHSNADQKDHASWLHPAIELAFNDAGKNLNGLQAIGITAGPGSYTGLRVGMAAAKGLCYALNIPLIAVNTLEAMATVATGEKADYICPMIDARRMEVFTALYDKTLVPVLQPCAMILEKNSFNEYLSDKTIVFLGDGKNKFEAINEQKTAFFKNVMFNASDLAVLTYKKFVKSEFSPLAYTELTYLKGYQAK